MNPWIDLVNRSVTSGAVSTSVGGRPVVARFGSAEDEYAALGRGPALVDRSYRGLLEIAGRDRVSWLHNLTTNQVKTLGRDEGVYAFALNVQGRILFDLNVLCRPESLWVDIDRMFLPTAVQQFNKYIIMEDVRVVDRSDEYVRLALVGEAAAKAPATMGVPHAGALPALGQAQAEWNGLALTVLRHDFCGTFGLEFFVPLGQADSFWHHLIKHGEATPAGSDAVQVRRIEAGLPWPGFEIAGDVLPAETGQLERAVSFQKGCYLGQEIVERMRSRKIVARLLCGLLVQGEVAPPAGADIHGAEGRPIGKVTSSCHSWSLRRPIALGYVRTADAAQGAEVGLAWGGGTTTASIAPLPFVGRAAH